jgi:hypothetical protein
MGPRARRQLVHARWARARSHQHPCWLVVNAPQLLTVSTLVVPWMLSVDTLMLADCPFVDGPNPVQLCACCFQLLLP